jgi:hypothetical protein
MSGRRIVDDQSGLSGHVGLENSKRVGVDVQLQAGFVAQGGVAADERPAPDTERPNPWLLNPGL